ncbi:MAG: S1-C subfamily serine protease [Myxococcota bacterium]|jgi:S1-C subfamily serine protease
MRHALAFLFWTLLAVPTVAASPLDDAVAAFATHTGARLVFHAADLPSGRYYDRMPVLDEAQRTEAARVLLREARKYPRGYLSAMGMQAVGVFEALVSDKSDGFRPFNEAHKGYVYFGLWNGSNAVVAAYYTDSQLPLTFHHEVFHHVDATQGGRLSRGAFEEDDARFREAVEGKRRYPAASISKADLRALRARSDGYTLENAVGAYAKKNAGEDQAETARYMMTTLPDALVQMATRPTLAGSQRMLHLVNQYTASIPDGPGVSWFVDVALGRVGPAADLAQLRVLSRGPMSDVRASEARQLLRAIRDVDAATWSNADRRGLLDAASALTPKLVRHRTRARANDTEFTIWVGKTYDNVSNHTLRDDVRRFGEDAALLTSLAHQLRAPEDAAVQRAQLASLRLIARYFAYIDGRWSVSSGTRAAFEEARATIAKAVQNKPLGRRLQRANLASLADAIGRDGAPSSVLAVCGEARCAPSTQLLGDGSARRRLAQNGQTLGRGAHVRAKQRGRFPTKVEKPRTLPVPSRRRNPYLVNVDAEIDDPAIRRAIRAVQPAAVKIGGGSGVNLAASGLILTNAHVADGMGQVKDVRFPDGQRFRGRTVAYNAKLDLALVRLSGGENLPTAPIAARSANTGDFVAAIGQPGTRTPDGKATGYKPFHVSTGEIRGFRPNLLGGQSLGRAKHDAWTYWGHSGSPLFNADGAIVALHNSWDSTTAMRHAVPHQAIVHFLDTEEIAYRSE